MVEYSNGLLCGRNDFWFENGKPQFEETYKITDSKTGEGKTSVLHGDYKNFSIRGVEMISGTYNMGKRNGKFTYRNANGGVIKVEYYKDDI